ncbi:MAG: phage holin family protein [Proteobacteria bacterium]|nr:phage holin family protein [Pseudomonadota bacterium]MBU1594086.1 phage holin family protein [Pseudomonadota bacterium]
MSAMSSALQDLAGAAGRLGGLAAGILKDRLELLALELREGKVRIIQVLILAFLGTALVLFGLFLLILAGVYALPEQWRLAGLFVAGLATLLGGLAALCSLRRRLGARSGLFAQTLAELEKDKACF